MTDPTTAIALVAATAAVVGAWPDPPGRTNATEASTPPPIGPLLVGSMAIAGVVLHSPTVVVVGPMALVVGRRVRRRLRTRADTIARRTARRELVDDLVHRLEGGESLAAALLMASTDRTADADPALGSLIDAVDLGIPIARAAEDALLGLSSGGSREDSGGHTVGEDDVRLVLGTLLLAGEGGGSAAAPLRRSGDVLADRLVAADDLATQTRQATVSASVLALLPVGFGAAMAAVDPATAAFYRGDPIGTVCLVVGGALAYGGWEWMQRLVVR